MVQNVQRLMGMLIIMSVVWSLNNILVKAFLCLLWTIIQY